MQIDRHRGVPPRGILLPDRTLVAGTHAGIADEHVDRTELLGSLVDGGMTALSGRKRRRERRDARVLDRRQLFHRARDSHHAGTGVRKRDRRRPSDSTAGAGNEGYASFQRRCFS